MHFTVYFLFVYLIWTAKRAWISLGLSFILSYICRVHFDGEHIFVCYLCYFVIGGLIYLYRDKIESTLQLSFPENVVIIIGLCIIFLLPVTESIILTMVKNMLGFACIVLGALCPDSCIWSNKIASFLRSISLEVYLLHMMVFRIVKRLGLTNLKGESLISYIFVCIFTVYGTVGLSILYSRIEYTFVKRLFPGAPRN